MKRILAAILTASMAFGLAACGTSSESESAGDSSAAETNDDTTSDTTADSEKEPVTIRFYNYALSEEDKAAWWEKTIQNFEEENDWITVETVAVDYNSMVETYTNDIAAGLSVDLIYGEGSWVPALADAEFIQAPENVIDADFYEGYYDYVLDQLEYDGTVYAVPQYYTNSVIFVNKELVEAAGLSLDEFPDTEDGLKEWIETLSAYYAGDENVSTIFGLTTAEVSATGANINALYTAFGGTLIDESGTLADLTSGQNATALSETLDFYNYLISNGYTQENLKLKDYRASFGAGNVVMYVDSSWGYSGIAGVDSNASEFTVTESLPTKLGTYGEGNSLIEAHCFLIGADIDDNQAEAINLFVQYATSSDTLADYLTELGLAFPAHEEMADFEISPILEGAAEGVDHVVRQTQIAPILSVQTELATLVLNYTVNGLDKDEAIADYIEQAEYYINQ